MYLVNNMKTYGEFINPKSKYLEEREEIEWVNVWRDKANEKCEKRVMLLGDSTSRIMRGALSAYLQVPVDLLATSAGLHDELFINQLDAFFASEEYTYTTIFVQIGHHAMIASGGLQNGYLKDKDYEIFEQDFRKLIQYLQQFTDEIIIESIFYSVFPYKRTILNRLRRPKEKYNDEINAMKERKNEIMKKVAEDVQLPYCDINRIMMDKGSYYRHFDDIHYEERAKPFIVREMARYMRNIVE